MAALQAAWSAVIHTPVLDAAPTNYRLVGGLETAIRIGDDTDTVAAIAGALLGARYGASAVPAAWRRISHGYPGVTGERLVELAHLAASGGHPGVYGWPLTDRIDYSSYDLAGTPISHPYDSGVWLADAAALDELPDDVTAVVSLCLVGREQISPDVEHVVFRLIDHPDPRSIPTSTSSSLTLPRRLPRCGPRATSSCSTASLGRAGRHLRRSPTPCASVSRCWRRSRICSGPCLSLPRTPGSSMHSRAWGSRTNEEDRAPVEDSHVLLPYR